MKLVCKTFKDNAHFLNFMPLFTLITLKASLLSKSVLILSLNRIEFAGFGH